jgi:hypothetical protein
MYDSFNGLNARPGDPIDSFTARTPGMDTFESDGEPQGDGMGDLIQMIMSMMQQQQKPPQPKMMDEMQRRPPNMFG